MKRLFPVLVVTVICALFIAASSSATQTVKLSATQTEAGVTLAAEKHLRNVRQLTFGGENAEAYFSGDGKQLIFQSKRDGRGCDQIYTMRADGSDTRMVSTGQGRTTCSYIFPKNPKRIL
jgi:Tol biopolymer transport system component